MNRLPDLWQRLSALDKGWDVVCVSMNGAGHATEWIVTILERRNATGAPIRVHGLDLSEALSEAIVRAESAEVGGAGIHDAGAKDAGVNDAGVKDAEGWMEMPPPVI